LLAPSGLLGSPQGVEGGTNAGRPSLEGAQIQIGRPHELFDDGIADRYSGEVDLRRVDPPDLGSDQLGGAG